MSLLLQPGYLYWDGLKYTSGPTIALEPLVGDVTGSLGANSVIRLNGHAISADIPGNTYVLTWVAANNRWEPQPSFVAGGDLSGSMGNQTVIGIRGKTLASSLSTIGSAHDGYLLSWVIGSSSWQAKPKEHYNVKDYGAIGNGIADDTLAIAAIFALAQTTGGEVFFPPTSSYYKITGPVNLPSYVNVRGAKSQGAFGTYTGSVISFIGAGAGFVIPGNNNTTLTDIQLIIGASAGPAIYMPTGAAPSSYLVFSDIDIWNTNPAKAVIQFGQSGANNGVQAFPVTFTRIHALCADNQAVPLTAFYGQGGGLSYLKFETCLFQSPSVNPTTRELMLFEATDTNGYPGIEIRHSIFENPLAGAVVFSSIQRSIISNCWFGDIVGTNTAPMITIKKSTTGVLASANISIDTLWAQGAGRNVDGYETVWIQYAAAQGFTTILNSSLPAVRNKSGTPLNTINCAISALNEDLVGGNHIGLNGGAVASSYLSASVAVLLGAGVGISSTGTAGANLCGQLTITGGSGAAVTYNLPHAEPDASYRFSVTPVSSTGTPAAGSNRVLSIAKTTAHVVVTLEADPGGGNTVTFDWMLLR